MIILRIGFCVLKPTPFKPQEIIIFIIYILRGQHFILKFYRDRFKGGRYILCPPKSDLEPVILSIYFFYILFLSIDFLVSLLGINTRTTKCIDKTVPQKQASLFQIFYLCSILWDTPLSNIDYK